jgi:hypothetical protein
MFPANPTGLVSNKSIDCAVNLTRIGVHEIILQTVVCGMVRMRAFAAWACAQRLFIAFTGGFNIW